LGFSPKKARKFVFCWLFAGFLYICCGGGVYICPKFAEDINRDVFIIIRDLDQFKRFSVGAENFESIHNHSAYVFAEFK